MSTNKMELDFDVYENRRLLSSKDPDLELFWMCDDAITPDLVGSTANLPSNSINVNELPEILSEAQLPKHVLSKIRNCDSWIKHVMKETNSEGELSFYVLERYACKKWLRWRLSRVDILSLNDTTEYRKKDNEQYPSNIREWERKKNIQLLGLWNEDPAGHIVEDNEIAGKLDLKPPNKSQVTTWNKKRMVKKVGFENPKQYLIRKYYENVFALSLPIAYFVKSAMVKVRNFCQSASTSPESDLSLQVVLSRMTLTIDEFDMRHDTAGHDLVASSLGSPMIEEQRRKALASIGISAKPPKPVILALSDVIKAKEIKLQIILLLELIDINRMDTQFDNFEVKYKKRMEMRARNVAKLRRIRVGKGKKTRHRADRMKLDFCERVDIFVDKLCIIDSMLSTEIMGEHLPGDDDTIVGDVLDTLKEHTKSMADPTKEPSSQGFLTCVLIPYYAQRTPNAVSFIRQKIKGLSFNSNRKLGRSRSAIAERSFKHEDGSLRGSLVRSASSFSGMEAHDTTSDVSGDVSRRSSLPQNPPMLERKSQSQLGELLQLDNSSSIKPIKANRAGSDVLLTRLQKRQLSVTDLVSESQELDKTNSLGVREGLVNSRAQVKRSETMSFQRVGKRQSVKKRAFLIEEPAAIQVQATPFKPGGPVGGTKPGKKLTVVESPLVSLTRDEDSPGERAPIIGTAPATPGCQAQTTRDMIEVPGTGIKAANWVIASPQLPAKKRVRRRLFGSIE
ncbi:LAMI_0F08372g1_1 [Lachancea mirantina]|uniref:LAMI_0F08372g1_1 n=1 Tax=Lachancea mirantina TaxID=1230905 RepID=A0A1G4K0B9_9SACH|nr:LAMI_0F08372g1_1 [Lachancea mirantina]